MHGGAHKSKTPDKGRVSKCAGVIAGVITGLLALSFFGLACVASFAATSAGIGAFQPLSQISNLFPSASCKGMHTLVTCFGASEEGNIALLPNSA